LNTLSKSKTRTAKRKSSSPVQGFRAAFDKLEGAVLEAGKDVNTKITEQYLGEGSKKVEDVQEKTNSQGFEVIETSYSIETKFGTVAAAAHRLVQGRSTERNTANEFFIRKSPLEKWQSCRFKESLLLPGTDLSDRKTALLLNKLRDQDDGVIPTTVRNCLERNGVAIAKEIEAKAERALDDVDFIPGIVATKDQLELFNDKSFFLNNDIIAESAKNIGILDYCQADYEDP
jgi:hypothetical protein